MATVQVTVPDALVPRLKAAMRATYPEHAALTDAAAFKATTADFWRSVLTAYEERQAESTAQALNTEAIRAAREQAKTDAAGIA